MIALMTFQLNEEDIFGPLRAYGFDEVSEALACDFPTDHLLSQRMMETGNQC